MPTSIVGRVEELVAIDHTLSQLGQGGPAALEVRGEPGIGKTRLLAELAARADARKYLVLSGSASELEADLPFWVLVDALDEYLAALEPHRLDALDEEIRTELAMIFPALSRFTARTPPCLRMIGTAPTARCGNFWNDSRRPSRSCSYSTTCTERTPHRRSYWARCCGGPPMRPFSLRWQCGPVKRRTGC